MLSWNSDKKVFLKVCPGRGAIPRYFCLLFFSCSTAELRRLPGIQISCLLSSVPRFRKVSGTCSENSSTSVKEIRVLAGLAETFPDRKQVIRMDQTFIMRHAQKISLSVFWTFFSARLDINASPTYCRKSPATYIMNLFNNKFLDEVTARVFFIVSHFHWIGQTR